MKKSFAPATLGLQAYERLRTKILTGEYALGAPLSRRRIAEELGISLVPVSEALQRLQTDGLVESKPRAGTRVRIPTVEDIHGHYIVREALESQSARLFARLATKEQKSELRDMSELVDRLSAALSRVDNIHRTAASYEFEKTHMRLHARIAECTECPALVDAIERSRVLINNWLFTVAANLDPLPHMWHRDLIRALMTGDVLEADAAMRRHVNYRQETILERFTELERTGRFDSLSMRLPQRRQPVVA